MTFGPTYIYECPQCNNLISRGSIASGNTFDMKLYSDAKRITPMLMEFPNITKCEKCNHIFKIDDLKEIGKYSWGEEVIDDWKNADEVNFLDIYDNFTALTKNIAKTDEEELDIRLSIWWLFNDRVRNDEDLFSLEDDKNLWQDNLNRLIELLSKADQVNIIMIAEIYRSLGDFVNCMKIIDGLDAEKYDFLKVPFSRECKAKNTKVFQLI